MTTKKFEETHRHSLTHTKSETIQKIRFGQKKTIITRQNTFRIEVEVIVTVEVGRGKTLALIAMEAQSQNHPADSSSFSLSLSLNLTKWFV